MNIDNFIPVTPSPWDDEEPDYGCGKRVENITCDHCQHEWATVSFKVYNLEGDHIENGDCHFHCMAEVRKHWSKDGCTVAFDPIGGDDE